MNTKVTVIIVNWNGEHYLSQCLSAVLAQTVMPNEIILVDNASSDKSLEIVRRFPSVRLIAQDENLGFARGNNLAIEQVDSQSDWIALLNPDAFPEPDWLEVLMDATKKNAEFTVFASRQIMHDNRNLLDGDGDLYHMSGLAWRNGKGKLVDKFSKNSIEVFSPCAAAALYQKRALLDAGGFDENYFCYFEDMDLGFRLRLAGHRCLLVPGAQVYHVGAAMTGGQQSDFSVYHGHRNLVWTYIKNMPGWLFWVCLPAHIVLNVVSIIWFVLRGKGKVIYKAKRDAILGLPGMWRKRQVIQKGRVAAISEIWDILDKRLIPVRHYYKTTKAS
jgi:GT2 family glycosyltransferase